MSTPACTRRHFLPGAIVPLGSLLAAALCGAPAAAQTCPAAGSKAMVCEVRIFVASPGERLQHLDFDRVLTLSAGQRVELAVEARDQYGREFPDERMRFGLDLDRSCRDLVSIEEDEEEGRFEVRAGARRGACDLWLWVPGNLNLEWPVRVEVAGLSRHNLSRFQAERIAERLYRAILGRDPDEAGLRAAANDIQRGDLEDVAEGMLRSEEFQRIRAGLPPRELLESFYRGLFNREPDSSGLRNYLDDMERGRYRDVIRAMIASEEFDGVLVEK